MIVLLSGGIAVGKTAVAEALAPLLEARLVRVREALTEVLGLRLDSRAELQRHGADLDARTAGRWLRDYLMEASEQEALVVDALRTRRQTLPVLDGLLDSRLVHLRAHETVRRTRYEQAARSDPVKAGASFDAAVAHPTEREADQLQALAHLTIETDEMTAEGIAGVIRSELGP